MAAGALSLECGYNEVIVADIAQRVGLTKRSFVNYVPDELEVLFGGAAAFKGRPGPPDGSRPGP